MSPLAFASVPLATLRLLMQPWEALSDAQQQVALRLAREWGRQILPADLPTLATDWRSFGRGLPNPATCFHGELLVPLRDSRLALQDAPLVTVADDPRARAYAHARHRAQRRFRLELSRRVLALSEVRGWLPHIATPERPALQAGRVVWQVRGPHPDAGVLARVLTDAERVALAAERVYQDFAVALDWPNVVSQLTGRSRADVSALRRDREFDRDGAAQVLRRWLRGAEQPSRRLAYAVIEQTTDWLPWLFPPGVIDGVEIPTGSGSWVVLALRVDRERWRPWAPGEEARAAD